NGWDRPDKRPRLRPSEYLPRGSFSTTRPQDCLANSVRVLFPRARLAAQTSPTPLIRAHAARRSAARVLLVPAKPLPGGSTARIRPAFAAPPSAESPVTHSWYVSVSRSSAADIRPIVARRGRLARARRRSALLPGTTAWPASRRPHD